jgi:hypothetical protein
MFALRLSTARCRSLPILGFYGRLGPASLARCLMQNFMKWAWGYRVPAKHVREHADERFAFCGGEFYLVQRCDKVSDPDPQWYWLPSYGG